MKKPLFISALVLAAIGAFADGSINVGNGISSTRFPIYGPELDSSGVCYVVGNGPLSAPTGSTVYTGALLSGSRYAIEFWAGPSTATDFSGLTLITSTTFRTAANPNALPNGITLTTQATVPGVAVGAQAKLGVRVWDTLGAFSWHTASMRGQSPTLFLSSGLGGIDGGGNPVLSPNWVGESFNISYLCPEPSVGGLMMLGMALVAWKRK